MQVHGLRRHQAEVSEGSMMRVGVAGDIDTLDDTVWVYWRNFPDGPERQ